jgi:hypothetical protein
VLSFVINLYVIKIIVMSVKMNKNKKQGEGEED